MVKMDYLEQLKGMWIPFPKKINSIETYFDILNQIPRFNVSYIFSNARLQHIYPSYLSTKSTHLRKTGDTGFNKMPKGKTFR